MAGDNRRTAPVDARPQQKGRLTVMIIRDVGRVLSFKISPRLVLPAAAILVLYLVASVLAINGYFNLRRLARKQAATLTQYEAREVKEAKRYLQAEERIAFLEGYIEDLEGGKRPAAPAEARRDAAPAPEKTEPPAPRPEAPEAQAPEHASRPEEARETDRLEGDGGREAGPQETEGPGGPGAGPTESVELKEAVVLREGADVTVRFTLINLNTGVKPATGFLHIIALGLKGGSPQTWSVPEEPLERGLPADYSNGRRYHIRRFKPIQGRFRLDPASETLRTVKILLYDPSGGLVVKEELEVDHAP